MCVVCEGGRYGVCVCGVCVWCVCHCCCSKNIPQFHGLLFLILKPAAKEC